MLAPQNFPSASARGYQSIAIEESGTIVGLTQEDVVGIGSSKSQIPTQFLN
jgi:hypothetical protein